MEQRRAGLSKGGSFLGLLGWIGITAAAAALGSAAAAGSREFYEGLQRPSWAPPASVFGPVWTVLYLAMAVAAWMVWRARNFIGARVALALFLGQLALNAFWTWLFFAWHQGALAFVDGAPALGRGRDDHEPVQEGQAGRRNAAHPVPRLGHLRRRAQLRGMEGKPGASLARTIRLWMGSYGMTLTLADDSWCPSCVIAVTNTPAPAAPRGHQAISVHRRHGRVGRFPGNCLVGGVDGRDCRRQLAGFPDGGQLHRLRRHPDALDQDRIRRAVRGAADGGEQHEGGPKGDSTHGLTPG